MDFKRVWLALLIVLSVAGFVHSADIRTGGGHVIYNDTTQLPQRPNLKFTGQVSCANPDSTTSECNVGVSGLPAPNYYVAGNGSDSYDCLSATYTSGTNGPCLTIQAAVNKIPQFFAGNTTLHIASGTYAELVTVEGFHPSGPYRFTIRGYINSTANQFSDVATVGQYTSSGSNTANFPTNTLSLFKDATNSPFTTADNEQLLYITGGASWCSSASDDYKNWYRIANQVSTSQLSVVTRWATCGNPVIDDIFRFKFNYITLSDTGTGGTLSASTRYYYRITATNANGQTMPTFTKSLVTGSGSNIHKITLTWDAVPGATGYKVYCRTSPEQLCATLGAVTTWDDTGSATPSGSLPLEDTTQTLPNNTTTYKIFRNVNMSTITGSATREYGLFIKNSEGIVVQNIRFTEATVSGIAVHNSAIDKIVGSVADNVYETTTRGAIWGAGFQIFASYVDEMRANLSTSNFAHNYQIMSQSVVNYFYENMSSNSLGDSGIQFTHMGKTNVLSTNLSKGDHWVGLNIEGGSIMEGLAYNRVDGTLSSPLWGGGHGLVVGTLSTVTAHKRNSFVNNASAGVLISDGNFMVSGLLNPVAIESLNNNIGIYITDTGQCVGCSDMTVTGNVSNVKENISANYREDTVDIQDEFIGGSYSSGSIGSLGWTIKEASNVLLLHMDGADASTTFTNSGSGTHTVTAVNAQIDTAQASKFLGQSGLFDGTGDWLTIPDSNNFNFTAGIWTVNVQVMTSSLAAVQGLWSQNTVGGDTDYTAKAQVETSGAVTFTITDSVGASKVTCTSTKVLAINTWYDIKFQESGDNYYIFVNDVQWCYASDVDRPDNYTSVFYVASVNATLGMNGWLDEFSIILGTPASVTASPLSTRPGIIRLTPNSSNLGINQIWLCLRGCDETTGSIDMSLSWEIVFSASITSADYTTMYAYFCMGKDTTWIDNYACVGSAAGTNANWRFVVAGGTNMDTGIPVVADTMFKFKIVKAGTTFKAYINDTLVGTQTGALTSQGKPMVLMQPSGATLKKIDLDYMNFHVSGYDR